MSAALEVLVQTLSDVEEAEVPAELRVIAFSKVFDLRAGGTPDPPAPAGGIGAARQSPPVDPSDPLGAIAAKIGVSPATVADVYDVRDGEIDLVIPASKLQQRAAAATKEIALLVAGGRQAAGIEEWTPHDLIRATCAEFKKLDSGNFAKTIRDMDDVFNVRKESDRKTQLRLSRPGWESYAELVKRLGGES